MKIKWKSIKRAIKYILLHKLYHNNIELCGKWAHTIPIFLTDRMGLHFKKGEMSCYGPYADPLIYHLHRNKYKFFYTPENTHVLDSPWQRWENCWLWADAPSLSMGFDYIDHPHYVRFPYWLDHIFGPLATREDIVAFIAQHDISSDSVARQKDCAFICKQDYFGDRAQMADLVAQIMPMSYPSDFRHNDDDMRGKFCDDKIAYLKQFKFNLCPENSNNRGYVTEKIFEAIKAGCVPIYWGNEGYPEPDILNPKAIVYLDKDNPEEGLTLLRKLNADQKAYDEFASQPRFLPGAADKIYAYYERLEEKLKVVLRQ